MHAAITARSFGAQPAVAEAVRAVHDGIAAASYASVRAVGGGLGAAASAALRARPPADPSQALSRSKPGSLALAALNGFLGFRLERELGVTPLYVRYNSGLHVSENGARLARLLDDVVSSWPCEVSELALVGHSMGGLVARSACHLAERDGGEWVPATRKVVYLGTPHLGAPLEKLTNVAAWGLAALPETRPVATVLNARSAGIKDLRYGSLLHEDWADCDPDALLGDRCGDVPLLETADHHWVCATLTRKPDGPLGRLVGDLLVLFSSGSGRGGRRGRRIPLVEENGHHLGGATHFDLLNHPVVDEHLRAWLA
jgi:pimeloyl-ACP methyl ester carboxylesterase